MTLQSGGPVACEQWHAEADRLTAVNAELLAALKAVASVDPYLGMYHCVFCNSNAVLRHDVSCSWAIAKAAIAKAETT